MRPHSDIRHCRNFGSSLILFAALHCGASSDFLLAADPPQTPSGSVPAIIVDSTADTTDFAVSDVPAEEDSAAKADGDAEASSSKSTDVLSELRRPLFNVSLATAAMSESVTREPLREPRNQAKEASLAAPPIYDFSGTCGVPRPFRDPFRICHWPLYFADNDLECCGQGHGVLTEGVIIARFFGRVPLLPCLMKVAPPRKCVPSTPCH